MRVGDRVRVRACVRVDVRVRMRGPILSREQLIVFFHTCVHIKLMYVCINIYVHVFQIMNIRSRRTFAQMGRGPEPCCQRWGPDRCACGPEARAAYKAIVAAEFAAMADYDAAMAQLAPRRAALPRAAKAPRAAKVPAAAAPKAAPSAPNTAGPRSRSPRRESLREQVSRLTVSNELLEQRLLHADQDFI